MRYTQFYGRNRRLARTQMSSPAVAYLQDQPSPEILRYRAAYSDPCAGDFLDVFSCADERTNIVFGDVCGRDAWACGYAGYLRHVVRLFANGRSPGRLLECVNTAFHSRVAGEQGSRFASLFMATLQGRRLTYASAGHDFAVLMSPRGRYCHLPPTGAIVGVDAVEFYEDRMTDVAPGDWLILVTDGITESRDRRGKFFGTSRVLREAFAALESGCDDPATRILDAAREHSRGRFADDASVLCVRFS
jgi:sigma-B regulation protein RsbU (phosphoserine phosphatase)